ncbi:MAG: LON peptidase substrate-binding domain-containing protein [Acidimicrobiales bacterium]|nr:LON peptidase substrate-binding domain-containing protein [Acidimicrobiales bacterium]
MFPLGSVLVPWAVLPIHVFEPRYRTMVRACLDGRREFGVVLITRGSEVGGNDQRTEVGTMAGIVEAQETTDGRWALVCVGLRRIRVTEWLVDDPFPRAAVTDWPDVSDAAALGRVPGIVTQLRRVLALAAEAGDPAPPATIELSDDSEVAAWQAIALAPIGALDRQRLLAEATVDTRLIRLADLLTDAAEVLELRLGQGDR